MKTYYLVLRLINPVNWDEYSQLYISMKSPSALQTIHLSINRNEYK